MIMRTSIATNLANQSCNVIIQSVNIKFCREILDKKFDQPKMNFSSEGLGSNTI